MRKTVRLLLVMFFCLLFAGCESGEKLTKDNYEDYLKISVTFDNVPAESNITSGYYKGAKGTVTVEGVTDRYDYKDAEVVVTINGTIKFRQGFLADEEFKKYDPEREFSVEVPVKLNISGDGSSSYEFQYEHIYSGTTFKNQYSEANGYDTYAEAIDANPDANSSFFPYEVEASYEITSVKGKLVK